MWIVLSVIIIFLVTVCWLLWARIVVCINSYQNQYYFNFGRLVKVEPVEQNNQVLIQVRLPFYRFTIDPFKPGKKKVDKEKKPEKKNKEKNGSKKPAISFYIKSAVKILRTFSFRHLVVDLDTGDFVLNAKLTPILVALNQRGGQFSINYTGNNNVWIEIENRLVRFLPTIFYMLKVKYLKT